MHNVKIYHGYINVTSTWVPLNIINREILFQKYMYVIHIKNVLPVLITW